MESGLVTSTVPLSSPLLDALMRRFRFAHGDLLRTLSLLSLTIDRGGVAPSPYAIDTALYVLGRVRRLPHMWDLLMTTHRIYPDAVTTRTAMIVLGCVAKVCSVCETIVSFRHHARMFRAYDTSDFFNALLHMLYQKKRMSDDLVEVQILAADPSMEGPYVAVATGPDPPEAQRACRCNALSSSSSL